MAFQPVPNVAFVQLEFGAGAITAQNGFYFHRDIGWDEPSLSALAENCVEAWDNNVKSSVTEDWALLRAVATNLESDIGLKQIWTPAVPIEGTILQQAAPANVTFAVKFLAPRRGRGINGRIFPIGLDETQVGAGFITSAYANQLVNAWRLFAEEVELNSNCSQVIVHRVTGGVRTPEGTWDTIAGYGYSDLALDSQKLRLPNHKKAKRRAAVPTP